MGQGRRLQASLEPIEMSARVVRSTYLLSCGSVIWVRKGHLLEGAAGAVLVHRQWLEDKRLGMGNADPRACLEQVGSVHAHHDDHCAKLNVWGLLPGLGEEIYMRIEKGWLSRL